MKIILTIGLLFGGYWAYRALTPPFADSREAFAAGQSSATLCVAGNSFPMVFDSGLSVAEALRRAGFHVSKSDQVYPPADVPLLPGTNIVWVPARTIRIVADGGEQDIETISPTSESIIAAAGIKLDEDDIVTPERPVTVADGMKISITRVEIREEAKETKIPFATKTEEDDELSWRKKVVKQKGENGIKTTVYKVSYHNGREVNRKLLSTEVTQEPVTEIVTQGTYVKTG
ncbi:MAG: G5 domain-containing protein, partial [Candidatus Moraniibacteriota bacterium]